MRMLWNREWREVPAYTATDEATEVLVTCSAPLIPLGDTIGRRYGSPIRKLLTFVLLEGPRPALAKARTKRRTSALSGDYHAVFVLGADDTGEPLAALCLKAPTSAQQMLAHPSLVLPAEGDWDDERVRRTAHALAASLQPHVAQIRESFLYSGRPVPAAIVEAFRRAVRRGGSDSSGAVAVLRPPAATPPLARVLSRRRVPEGTLIVLGAGDYVQSEILPAAVEQGLTIGAVVDREPQIAASVGAEYDAAMASTDAAGILADVPPGLVVVATAHDSHASLAARALECGHHVIVEKPAIVTREDLERLEAAIDTHPGRLVVGFNRRFHPLVRAAGAELAGISGGTSVSCIVREVDLQPDHWYFWPNQGTRVAGNLCHWIDLGLLFANARPTEVHLACGGHMIADEPSELNLTATFDDGSILTIHATSRGDGTRGVQERIEVRRGDVTLEIDDLRELRRLRRGRSRREQLRFRTRSHRAMYHELFDEFQAGRGFTLQRDHLVASSLVQLAATDLLRAGGGHAAIAPPGELRVRPTRRA